MAEEDSSNDSEALSKEVSENSKKVEGGKKVEKGKTRDSSEGSSGGHGFIRPSARSDSSDDDD